MPAAPDIHETARVHPAALIDAGARVGAGTRVWAFAHLAPGAVVGADCNVCDHTFIETGVVVGDRVTLKCGVYLWSGLRVEDDVFIGPGAVFTNDSHPRSRRRLAKYPVTLLRQGCSIGAGAILLPGVTIGRYALVGAGAVVTKDVPDHRLVYGNPAKLSGWVCVCGRKISAPSRIPTTCQCEAQENSSGGKDT